jgi:hypothetical protein
MPPGFLSDLTITGGYRADQYRLGYAACAVAADVACYFTATG